MLQQLDVISGGVTTLVTRLFVYFDVLPTVTAIALFSGEGPNESSFGFDPTTGQFATRIQSNSWVSGGPVVATGKWYRIDLKQTCNANPNTIDWQVDGAAQVQNSAGFAASSWTEFRIGAGTNGVNSTCTVYIDELAVSVTGADYPIGDGRIIGYSPTADGAHSFTLGDFQYENSVNVGVGAVDVFSHVDEVPLTSVADFIKQVVIRAAGYVAVNFPLSAETVDPRGVELVSAQHAITTPIGTAVCTMKFFVNGTLVTVYAAANFPDASGVVQSTKHYAVSPATGLPWTRLELFNGASEVRWGFSTDVSVPHCLDTVMLEVEFPPGLIIRDAGAKSQYYNALIRM
jgi:hypothetical protein